MCESIAACVTYRNWFRLLVIFSYCHLLKYANAEHNDFVHADAVRNGVSNTDSLYDTLGDAHAVADVHSLREAVSHHHRRFAEPPVPLECSRARSCGTHTRWPAVGAILESQHGPV